MYDINTKNVKKGKSFYFLFFIVGIFFLVIFLSIIISGVIKKNSLDSKTVSTKIEVRTHEDSEGDIMYSPIYYYRVNGKDYRCESNISSSNYPNTSNGTVYYDSSEPSRCMTDYVKSNNNLILIFIFIPILSIGVALVNFIKINKRLKIINNLNKNGKLIKNLPYHLENTGMVVNGIPIQRPVVDYTLPSGLTITLYGDPRHDEKLGDADGLVDLVIDENNPENYYIDFEINRITGNLPQDYNNNPLNQDNQNIQSNSQIQNNATNSTDIIKQGKTSTEQVSGLSNLYGTKQDQNNNQN